MTDRSGEEPDRDDRRRRLAEAGAARAARQAAGGMEGREGAGEVISDRLSVWARVAGVAGSILLAGCSGPRVVFVPSADAPVRAGPGVRGRVYVWTGSTWELSRNRVPVPEGFYIWDAGDAAPDREKGSEQP